MLSCLWCICLYLYMIIYFTKKSQKDLFVGLCIHFGKATGRFLSFAVQKSTWACAFATCVLPVLRHGNNSMLTSFYWQLKAHTKSYKYFENVHIKINQRDAFCTNIKKTINVHKQLQKSEKQQNLLEIYKHSLELWWGQVLTATVVWHHTGLSTCHLEGCCPHLESLKSRRWKWAKCAF